MVKATRDNYLIAQVCGAFLELPISTTPNSEEVDPSNIRLSIYTFNQN